MKETVKLFQHLLYYCEGLALLAGIIAWKFITDKKIKAFVLYLLFIIICEQTGAHLTRLGLKPGSAMLYNYLAIPVEFLFAFWFLYAQSDGRISMGLYIIFSALSILVRVIEFTFLKDEKFFFSSLSYIISSFFLLILLLLFLWEFIKTDKLIQYQRHFSFWVAIAMLIYYLGSFPLYAFYNYLYDINKSVFYLYWEIQMCLNMCMYLLFSAGLLWTNLKYKYS